MRSSLPIADVERIATDLFAAALEDAVILTVPVVLVVAAIGVLIGTAQTLIQVQDQNVAFAPKLVAVAAIAAYGGHSALAVLQTLFQQAVAAIPIFAR